MADKEKKEKMIQAEILRVTDEYAIIFINVITNLVPEDMEELKLLTLHLLHSEAEKVKGKKLFGIVKTEIGEIKSPNIKKLVEAVRKSKDYTEPFDAIYTIAENPMIRFAYGMASQIVPTGTQTLTAQSKEDAVARIEKVMSGYSSSSQKS